MVSPNDKYVLKIMFKKLCLQTEVLESVNVLGYDENLR